MVLAFLAIRVDEAIDGVVLLPLLLHRVEKLVEFRAGQVETHLKNLAHSGESGAKIRRHQSPNPAAPMPDGNIDRAFPHMLHAGLMQILIERARDDPAGVQSPYRG